MPLGIGIHYDIPWSEYRALPFPSPSTLKHGMHSMKRLKRALDRDPSMQPSKKTTAVGNCVHALVADEFDDRYTVMPRYELDEDNVTLKTKSPPKVMRKNNGDLSANGLKWVELCKQHGHPEDYTGEIVVERKKPDAGHEKMTGYYRGKKAEFEREAEESGKEVMLGDDVEEANRMLEEMRRNREFVEFVKKSKREVTLIADIHGMKVKTRLDLHWRDGREVLDIKTLPDATNTDETPCVHRKCKSLGYYFSFAFHRECLRSLGEDIDRYWILAAEVAGDRDNGMLEVPTAILDKYAGKVSRVIGDMRGCQLEDSWPGMFAGGPSQVVVPNWDMMDDQDELDFAGVM